MPSPIVTISSILAMLWLTPSVETRRMTPVRLSPRADHYVWTITWTGPKTCSSWPCSYSYEVSAPTYTAAEGAIPFFDATCQGTVDQPLQACSLLSTQLAGAPPVKVLGNFSTFETSGVGSGLIDITAMWFDQSFGVNRTLTGTTPMQASSANHNTWTLNPEGCPVTDCVEANATRTRRRSYIGIEI